MRVAVPVTLALVQLPGRGPQTFAFPVRIRRVSCPIPVAHEEGMERIRLSYPRFNCFRDARALHWIGRGPVSRELLEMSSSVKPVSTLHETGNDPVKAFPGPSCKLVRVVIHFMESGSVPDKLR